VADNNQEHASIPQSERGLELAKMHLDASAINGASRGGGNGSRVMNVEAAMVARVVGGALLYALPIAIIAAIIVTLVSLAMFLREPIYEPTARVWVERELLISPRAPGPDKRLTETTRRWSA
jgi:hypothetical protein